MEWELILNSGLPSIFFGNFKDQQKGEVLPDKVQLHAWSGGSDVSPEESEYSWEADNDTKKQSFVVGPGRECGHSEDDPPRGNFGTGSGWLWEKAASVKVQLACSHEAVQDPV